VTVQWVPDGGMIATSLTDAGTELLGQRRGLDAYLSDGKTMGIPILYPWANRLGDTTYTAENVTVTLTPGENGVRPDPNGLPIHGVLAAYPGWRVTAESATELTAEVDFGADPRLLASFPYPHLLAVAARLTDRTLTVRSTVTATGDVAVPLADVQAIPVAAPGSGPTVGAVEQALAHTGYSRFPIANINGDFIGYLHIKDVLPLGDDPHAVVDLARVRPLPKIPESLSVPEALSRMRRSKSHLALVTAQDGAVVAMVALEDLVRDLVGMVRDGMQRV